MDKQSYEDLRKNNHMEPSIISVDQVAQYQKEDGTLLYGYTCDRDTFHVYLKNGELHRVIYDFDGDVLDYIHGAELEADLLHPNKRIYPEASSYDFIVSLRKTGCDPSLTTFNESREQATWHGEVWEDLKGAPIKN